MDVVKAFTQFVTALFKLVFTFGKTVKLLTIRGLQETHTCFIDKR